MKKRFYILIAGALSLAIAGGVTAYLVLSNSAEKDFQCMDENYLAFRDTYDALTDQYDNSKADVDLTVRYEDSEKTHYDVKIKGDGVSMDNESASFLYQGPLDLDLISSGSVEDNLMDYDKDISFYLSQDAFEVSQLYPLIQRYTTPDEVPILAEDAYQTVQAKAKEMMAFFKPKEETIHFGGKCLFLMLEYLSQSLYGNDFETYIIDHVSLKDSCLEFSYEFSEGNKIREHFDKSESFLSSDIADTFDSLATKYKNLTLNQFLYYIDQTTRKEYGISGEAVIGALEEISSLDDYYENNKDRKMSEITTMVGWHAILKNLRILPQKMDEMMEEFLSLFGSYLDDLKFTLSLKSSISDKGVDDVNLSLSASMPSAELTLAYHAYEFSSHPVTRIQSEDIFQMPSDSYTKSGSLLNDNQVSFILDKGSCDSIAFNGESKVVFSGKISNATNRLSFLREEMTLTQEQITEITTIKDETITFDGDKLKQYIVDFLCARDKSEDKDESLYDIENLSLSGSQNISFDLDFFYQNTVVNTFSYNYLNTK